MRAVTEIGDLRGCQLAAEWITSMETVDLLVDIGVDYAQGFALHVPERVLFQR